MPAPGSSDKSDQRRQVVLQAAVTCFARKGFYGTTTAEIAERAGISQPYIYRLFADKATLFAGAVLHVSDLITAALSTGAEDGPRTPQAAMQAARAGYRELIQNRDVMRFLMHANCAAEEPLIAEAVRSCYARQVTLARDLLGDDEAVRQWLGAGMLENVTVMLNLADVEESWARTMTPRQEQPL
ncbi:hypothetical protein Kisp01_66740 [Kineosporia sp. NBRC 101677]|uniref:TetR/AcrR family transcriptional regulator n=1 Tax=Kineosporia sp. NBRC 101677 TaxID=3032197 RepID=UPI0024A33437|nr:TetR/AcrR family transcriptional regulator [Kineosporia sp. NBRC 101677]GLY19660.1 hypothetical protein Kisp01_66740 [Kineosporia sp. NBRC 101677]